jgi:hypothetical protein
MKPRPGQEISDDMMRAFGKPVIDRCLKDAKYRRKLLEQMHRVFGKRNMAELIYLTCLDERPDLNRRPVIKRAIRRNLGL